MQRQIWKGSEHIIGRLPLYDLIAFNQHSGWVYDIDNGHISAVYECEEEVKTDD